MQKIDGRSIVISLVILLVIGAGGYFTTRAPSKPDGIMAKTEGATTPRTEVNPNTKTTTQKTQSTDTTPVSIGQSTDVGDLNIRLTSVKNDSRCIIGEKCVNKGTVNIGLRLSEGGKFKNTTYSSNSTPLEYHGYKISVVSVTPEKKKDVQVKPADYSVVLNVEAPAEKR